MARTLLATKAEVKMKKMCIQETLCKYKHSMQTLGILSQTKHATLKRRLFSFLKNFQDIKPNSRMEKNMDDITVMVPPREIQVNNTNTTQYTSAG